MMMEKLKEKIIYYRKKPVVVKAMQLPEIECDASEELIDFLHEGNVLSDNNEGISIETTEGVMRGNPGDWVIRGVNGEYYPCKPDVFEKTHEPA